MLKLPEDIMNRSKSTQIQWAIVILMISSGFVFLIVSGIVYLVNIVLPTIGLEFEDTVRIWLVSMILITIGQYIKLKSSIQKVKKLKKALDKLEEVSKEIKEYAENQNKIINDKLITEVIPIEYLGKTVEVTVKFEKSEEESEEESILKIMDNTFKGIVIEAHKPHSELADIPPEFRDPQNFEDFQKFVDWIKNH
jgi:uncharacterized membrane protein